MLDRYNAPGAVWEYIGRALEVQKQQVSYACAVVAK